MKIATGVAALLAVLTFCRVGATATIYVDAGADLQAAIDAAEDGDDIFVAGGTYGPITVEMKKVHLYGGYDASFTGTSSDTASVIEGSADVPSVSLFEVGSSVVEGFTIRGGQRGVIIDADFQSTTNKPTLRSNIIEENGTRLLSGGGVYADHCGATLQSNTIRGNIGDRGAGIASACDGLVIDGNIVENNVASGDHGGGIYLSGAGIVVRRNVVRNNEVGVIAGYGWGAGFLIYNPGSSATLEHNVFTLNHAQSLGGGAFVDDGASATFTGDLFYANACGENGGAALYVDGYDADVSSTARLVNVTIAAHACPDTQGNAVSVEAQSTVTLENSIVWNNGGDDFNADATSSIAGTYTLSEEALEGTGNLSEDPLFFDPAAGDFHVLSTQGRFDPTTGEFVTDEADSPSIDAGDPRADFDLEPGPNGLRVNLGHTGNTPEASMGGPGGTPPGNGGGEPMGGSAEGGGGDGPDGDDGETGGCDCRAAAAPGHGSAVVIAVALALALGRRQVRRGGESRGA